MGKNKRYPLIKNSMDRDTILFSLKDGTGLAYNYTYYTRNVEEIQKKINSNYVTNLDRIFYKVTDKRDSWIDLDLAIKMFSGLTITERINAAYNNDDYRIKNIKIIPAAIYTDAYGYTATISPYDGLYSLNNFANLAIYDPLQIKYKYNGDDLTVAFGDLDVDDAFISMCSLFFDYTQVNKNTVLYRNVRDKLRLVATIGTNLDSFVPIFKVYKWNNIKKLSPLTPISRDHNLIQFDREIGNDGILIYKWVMYDYEIQPGDVHNKILVKGLNPELYSMIKLDEFKFYPLECTDSDFVPRKYWGRGIPNRYKNRVDFALPIRDSIILYGGVDHEYEILDLHSVYYPKSFYSILGVQSHSQINSLSILMKPLGTSSYLPNGTEILPGELILEEMEDFVEELNNKAKDGVKYGYQDAIVVKPFNPNTLYLKYKPMQGTLRLYINGVFYEKIFYEYDSNENTVIWKKLPENGFEEGFHISYKDRVTVEYNVDIKENNLTNINQVI